MRLPRLIIFFSLIWIISTAVPIKADFENDYQNFLKTYDNYRTAKANYSKTRNEYLTYDTLTSKNAALKGLKSFLVARNDVLLSYNSLLFGKNADPALNSDLTTNNNFIKLNSEKIPALGSLEDAVLLSKEIEGQHILFQITSRKVAGTILINKIKNIDNQFKSLEDESNNLIQTLKNQGREISSLERWLLDAKNKEFMADQKILSAQTQLNSFQTSDLDSLTSDYNKIQFTIFEANQYLKEGLNYLKELAQTIKYGKY